MKTLKKGQKWAINFDRKFKNAKHTVGVIKKYTLISKNVL